MAAPSRPHAPPGGWCKGEPGQSVAPHSSTRTRRSAVTSITWRRNARGAFRLAVSDALVNGIVVCWDTLDEGTCTRGDVTVEHRSCSRHIVLLKSRAYGQSYGTHRGGWLPSTARNCTRAKGLGVTPFPAMESQVGGCGRARVRSPEPSLPFWRSRDRSARQSGLGLTRGHCGRGPPTPRMRSRTPSVPAAQAGDFPGRARAAAVSKGAEKKIKTLVKGGRTVTPDGDGVHRRLPPLALGAAQPPHPPQGWLRAAPTARGRAVTVIAVPPPPPPRRGQQGRRAPPPGGRRRQWHPVTLLCLPAAMLRSRGGGRRLAAAVSVGDQPGRGAVTAALTAVVAPPAGGSGCLRFRQRLRPCPRGNCEHTIAAEPSRPSVSSFPSYPTVFPSSLRPPAPLATPPPPLPAPRPRFSCSRSRCPRPPPARLSLPPPPWQPCASSSPQCRRQRGA